MARVTQASPRQALPSLPSPHLGGCLSFHVGDRSSREVVVAILQWPHHQRVTGVGARSEPVQREVGLAGHDVEVAGAEAGLLHAHVERGRRADVEQRVPHDHVLTLDEELVLDLWVALTGRWVQWAGGDHWSWRVAQLLSMSQLTLIKRQCSRDCLTHG